MNSKADETLIRKLTVGGIVIAVLTLCLCITTYALVMVSVSVPDNSFKTGSVGVNLNDGKPVIEEHEFLFESGMTVTKEFFIENLSTCDVYYRLYMDEIKGGLATILEITISDGEKTLFHGTAAELSKERVVAADDVLKMDEKRDLTISFHCPEEVGNIAQNRTLSFTLCAEVVQTKNNSDKAFD